jgi:protein-S-isoprenylcysteine O-methyltransferase Ste14
VRRRAPTVGPILKTLLFTILVPGTVTVLIPRWLLGEKHLAPGQALGGFGWLGVIPMTLGAIVYLVCAWDFATVGKGTPAPIAPTENLVIRGLYQYVRNPMYIGVLLVLSGETIAFESRRLAVYAGVVWLFFHLFIISYEEPHLRARFGESYKDYRRRVPRWFPNL